MNHNSEWQILIIDDDEDDFVLTRDMLKEAKGRKLSLKWAANYSAGLQELASSPYDAVLVDYDLGHRSGIELIREVCKKEFYTPLILYTGRGNYSVDIEAMQAGATLYLSKNDANPLLLERVIRYAVERKQIEKQLRASNEQLAHQLLERKQVETALRSSEERFYKAFHASPSAQIISHLEDGLIEVINSSFERLFGYSREEVLGKTSLEMGLFSRPEDREELVRRIRTAKSLRDYEIDIRTKAGEIRNTILSVEFLEIDGEPLILTVIQDITERRQREATLRESEARFHALISASAQVLYSMSPDWQEMRQLQGGNFLADTDQPNRNWMQEYIHPDDQEWVWEVIQNAVRTGSVFELEHRVLRVDGTLGWTASRAVPVRKADGEIIEWFGAASDITERKNT